MRNESDIFCLKELKDGEVDGTQMFSVSGQCPLKINRRRAQHTASSTFEYGSIPPKVGEELRMHQEGLKLEGDEADMLGPDEESQEMQEGERVVADKNVQKKMSPLSKKMAEKVREDMNVTQSAMARNPLTGAGVEMEQHRKPKKGIKDKMNKWVW